jgi:hypothetical protein
MCGDRRMKLSKKDFDKYKYESRGDLIVKAEALEKEVRELRLINQMQLENLEKMRNCGNCEHNVLMDYHNICMPCVNSGNRCNWEMKNEFR